MFISRTRPRSLDETRDRIKTRFMLIEFAIVRLGVNWALIILTDPCNSNAARLTGAVCHTTLLYIIIRFVTMLLK